MLMTYCFDKEIVEIADGRDILPSLMRSTKSSHGTSDLSTVFFKVMTARCLFSESCALIGWLREHSLSRDDYPLILS